MKLKLILRFVLLTICIWGCIDSLVISAGYARADDQVIGAQISVLEQQTPAELRSFFARLRNSGFNTVVLRVFHNRYDRYHQFDHPKIKILPKEGVYFQTSQVPVIKDLLPDVCRAAHAEGLRIFAWMTTLQANYSHRDLPKVYAYDHLHNRYQPTGALDPAAEKNRQFLTALFRDLAANPIDGILFQDDLLLKHTEGFHPDPAGKSFVPNGATLYLYSDGGDRITDYRPPFWKWNEQKASSLQGLANAVMEACRQVKPGLLFAQNIHYELLLKPRWGRAWFSQTPESLAYSAANYFFVMSFQRQIRQELEVGSDKELDEVMNRMFRSNPLLDQNQHQLIFKLQATDWQSGEPESPKRMARMLRLLKQSNHLSAILTPYNENYFAREIGSFAARQEVAGTPAEIPAADVHPVAVKPSRKPAKASSAPAKEKKNLVTMTFRDTDIAEVFEMLAKGYRVNILMGKGVEGDVSCSLYDMKLDDAIYTIAAAADCGVEMIQGSYLILPKDQLSSLGEGRRDVEILTYKSQFVAPDKLKEALTDHVTRNAKITIVEENNMLAVQDTKESISRIKQLLKDLDRQPAQVLIEAKILEITLDNSETFGLDWKRLFTVQGADATIGLQGFANRTATGFVASFFDSNKIDIVLNALSTKGRLHTLSTPTLLALENQEAEVMIGGRQGYKVTTTINQVTSESIEFLDSGVILKVTPSIDNQGRVQMHIHPEVSTGSFQDGIPSQNTTLVTTDLLADDGQTIFIGGLIRKKTYHSKQGIPILGDIPLVGRVFSSTEETLGKSETIILITPHIITNGYASANQNEVRKAAEVEDEIALRSPQR
jgi:type II secretory pathway component GspD/PulD (secretin)